MTHTADIIPFRPAARPGTTGGILSALRCAGHVDLPVSETGARAAALGLATVGFVTISAPDAHGGMAPLSLQDMMRPDRRPWRIGRGPGFPA